MTETPVDKLEDKDLIRELGERFYGHADANGVMLWQSAMARSLEVSQSLVSAIASGQQRLSLRTRAKLLEWAARETRAEQVARMRRRALLAEVKRRFR